MICAPTRVGCRSKTFCGGEVWSLIVQWNTAVSVTRPIVVSEIHFQKTTSESLTWDLTFCLVSMLNICSVRPATRVASAPPPQNHLRHVPFSASIFLSGCIIAESAVMGLRSTLLASARSMMTTWFCSLTFSRTQMKWSDSNVKLCSTTRKRRISWTARYRARKVRVYSPGRRWTRAAPPGWRAGGAHRRRWALRYRRTLREEEDTSSPAVGCPADYGGRDRGSRLGARA